MITDKDIAKLKKTFATKDDLKTFATKDDLKNALKPYATKKDLEKFVTTKELEKTLEQYPTKDDLRDALRKTEKSLKDAIVEFKDEILSEVKKNRENQEVLTGYKDQIEDHETRIDKLEKTAFP